MTQTAPSQEKSKGNSKASNVENATGTPSSPFHSSTTEPPTAPTSKGRYDAQSPSKGYESKTKEPSSKKGRKNKSSQVAAFKAKTETEEQAAAAAQAQAQSQNAQTNDSQPNAWMQLDEAALRLEAKKRRIFMVNVKPRETPMRSMT